MIKRGWKLMVNVRIHVQVYAGFDDEFWSCNDDFCSARGGRMGGELTEGVGVQNPALHDQNSSSNPA